MYTKKFYESKLFWTGLISVILGAMQIFTPEVLATIGVHDTTKFLAIEGVVVGILTIIFRLFGTTTVISSLPSGTFVPVEKISSRDVI